MLETGKIDKEAYEELKVTIRENKEDWIEAVERYHERHYL